MELDERFELADLLRVVTKVELGLDALLDGGEAQLLEMCDLGMRERLVGEIRERRAAPEPQRLSQELHRALRRAVGERPRALLEQPLETCPVELVGCDPDLIAAPARHDHAVGAGGITTVERLAKPRDVHLQALGSAGGRVLAPQLVDQSVGRNDLVGVQQQDRQHRALLARERKLTPCVTDLERAEDPEFHV